MEEKQQDKNTPKDLIGKAERKTELSQKAVESAPVREDPYGGRLSKTNFLLIVLNALCSMCILVGAIWTAVSIFGKNANSPLKFSTIQTQVILMAVGFASLIVCCVLKSVVDKKRIESYSSTHQTKKLVDIKPKEMSTEKAKLGSGTSENTLTVSESKESAKFCPHCKKRIPESAGLFCPKCGKRMDITSAD